MSQTCIIFGNCQCSGVKKFLEYSNFYEKYTIHQYANWELIKDDKMLIPIQQLENAFTLTILLILLVVVLVLFVVSVVWEIVVLLKYSTDADQTAQQSDQKKITIIKGYWRGS